MKTLLLVLVVFAQIILADALKPALVEVTFFEDKRMEVAFQVSLEAILANISTESKDTTNSVNGEYYDQLRVLKPEVLFERFVNFENEYLSSLTLFVNGKAIAPQRKSHSVDIVGYAKRPRNSQLVYETVLVQEPNSLHWKYNESYGDSAFRYRFFQKDAYTWKPWIWLTKDKDTGVIDLSDERIYSSFDRFVEFLSIGFDHVVPLGLDHILFIVGMAMASISVLGLIGLVSSFTLAHTVTIGLGMYGVIVVNPAVIEPLIALSIAYIALENLLTKQHLKRKTIVVFFFGLLHGLGFAEMLKSFSMTKDNFLITLLGFNIGVEIAQICIILAVVAILFVLRKIKFSRLAVVVTSVAIGLTGLYWTYERVVG